MGAGHTRLAPFPFHESYFESELWQLEFAARNTSAKYAYFDYRIAISKAFHTFVKSNKTRRRKGKNMKLKTFLFNYGNKRIYIIAAADEDKANDIFVKAETWQAPGGKTVEPWLSETFCKEIEGVFSEEEGIKDKLELK